METPTQTVPHRRGKEALIASVATFVLTSMFYIMAFVLYPASLLYS